MCSSAKPNWRLPVAAAAFSVLGLVRSSANEAPSSNFADQTIELGSALADFCDRTHAADSNQIKSLHAGLDAKANADAYDEKGAIHWLNGAKDAHEQAITLKNNSSAPVGSAENTRLQNQVVSTAREIDKARNELTDIQTRNKQRALIRGAAMDCVRARERQLQAPPPKPNAATQPQPPLPPPAAASPDTIFAKGTYSETCYVGDAEGVTSPGISMITLNTKTNAVSLAVRAFKNGVLTTYRGTLASPDIDAQKLPDGTTAWNGSLTLIYKGDNPTGVEGSGGNYRTNAANNIKCNGDWEVKP